MFSDGIRPGGDLTELDGQPESRKSSRRSGSRGHKKSRSRQNGQSGAGNSSSRGNFKKTKILGLRNGILFRKLF